MLIDPKDYITMTTMPLSLRRLTSYKLSDSQYVNLQSLHGLPNDLQSLILLGNLFIILKLLILLFDFI